MGRARGKAVPVRVLIDRWQLAHEVLGARHACPRRTPGGGHRQDPLGSRVTEPTHSQGHSQGCSRRTRQAMQVPSRRPHCPPLILQVQITIGALGLGH